MMARAASRSNAGDSEGPQGIDSSLLEAAHLGKLDDVREAIRNGADVNAVHQQTGLTALHLAIGINHLPLVRFLIEEAGASVSPDRSGRWPSLIAAQCRVSEELGDYIVERESQTALL